MSYTETDYVTVTAANQFDTPIYMPKDSKPSSETYNINIYQRIANCLLWLKNQVDNAVKKTGNHTMTGNLTIPDGTAAGHAVNKGQLDAAIASVTAPTSSGDANNGYWIRADGWCEQWITINAGDVTNDLTINVPYLQDLSACVDVDPKLLAADANTDAFTTIRGSSYGLTSATIHIDEISGLTQIFKLKVYVRGWI